MNCYCKSGQSYELCCEPFITGKKLPENSEQLMRSRFSAYCLHNAQYIHSTYAPSKQSENTVEDILSWAKQCKFVYLNVTDTELNDNATQYVEFEASYVQGSNLEKLHERSRFTFENGRWFYLDGELYDTETQKLARNQDCPCQSGKKYKRCCGA